MQMSHFREILIKLSLKYGGCVKRIWYLLPMRAVSQEEPSDRKPDSWPFWMAGHAQLRFVMTEYSKTQIRLTGLIHPMQFKLMYHTCLYLEWLQSYAILTP